MNIILFEKHELNQPLSRRDDRAHHIIEVLNFHEGSVFDVGVVNGNMGKARIRNIDDDTLHLQFNLDKVSPPLHPIELIVGLPRPQTARDILRDATTMGVRRISFVQTERGERSYGESKIWRDDACRSFLLKGAQTAFSTRIPEVTRYPLLAEALANEVHDDSLCVALDNYEATESLSNIVRAPEIVTSANLAIGSERGWSAKERNMLREEGYTLASIGDRVLRTETAVIVGITILLAGMSRI